MTIRTANCTFGTTASEIGVSECGLNFWKLLEVLETGAIDINSNTGTEVSGLTIGKCYAIEAYNGPYDINPSGSTHHIDRYSFGITNDGSIIRWQGAKGHSSQENHAQEQHRGLYWWLSRHAWEKHAEWVSNTKVYARTYWIANTTSVWIGCNIGSDDYSGINGSLSYRLWDCGEISVVGSRLG